MDIVFDPKKDFINRTKHGISLVRASEIDMATAYIEPDASQDYGEARYIVIGWLDARLYTLVTTFQPGLMRAISLRKANHSEHQLYAEQS